jgi:adenylate cyclase
LDDVVNEPTTAGSAFDFADFRLEPRRRTLTRADGAIIDLRGKAFDALVYLVEHAGGVVDRRVLLQALWPSRVVEDNNLNQTIAVLRRALGEQHIVTVSGRGYQFVTPVRRVALAAPIHAVALERAADEPRGNDAERRPTAAAADPRSPARRSFFAWPWVATATLVVAGGWMVIESYRDAPRNTTERIAVLPCDDPSPDPNDAHFALGIDDGLAARLGQIRSLVVVGRSSVLRYAKERPPIPQIGADLGVDTIMVCGVRYDGDQVVVTVNLLDAASDEPTWSKSYPGDMSDWHSLFAIQADIAIDVAHALRVPLVDEEREQIEQMPTESREAYEFYVASQNAPTVARAIELVDLALDSDPEFVEAWLWKAGRHMFVAGLHPRDASDAHLANALKAAQRALVLDPYSPAAHAALAVYLGQTGDWIASQEAWDRAFALGQDPADGPYFLLKMAVGHFDAAVKAMEASLDRNPADQGSRSFLLIAYEVLGDREARRRHWLKGEELFGDSWQGDATEPGLRIAERDTEFLRTEQPKPLPGATAVWNAGRAHLDSPQAGLAAMRSLRGNPELQTATNLGSMAAWALFFGDPAVALEWFRESVELQATNMLNVWLPSNQELRREPGFKDLVRAQGLPEYWNRFGWPDSCEHDTEGDDFECD